VRRILAALHDVGDIEIRSIDIRFVEVIAPDERALEDARLAIVGAGYSAAVDADRAVDAPPTSEDDHGAPTAAETKTCVVREPLREEQPTTAAPGAERGRKGARRIAISQQARRTPPDA
jgi:hypothetical protein